MEAARSFAGAVALDPDYARAHLELGVEYLRAGVRLEDAIAEFRKALDLDPSLWQAKHHLADALRLTGDVDGALKVQRSLAADRPSWPQAHNNLGYLLLEKKKYAEAERCFREALKLKPDYALARGGLGTALWREGRLKEGISTLKEAIAELPDRVLLRVELSRALLAAGRTEEALSEVLSARELEPQNCLVYHQLAEVYVRAGDLHKARSAAQKAVLYGCKLSDDLRDKLEVTVEEVKKEAKKGVKR